MDEVRAAQDGSIGRITLNRPHVRNAIDVALATQLEAAVRQFGDTADVIVIRGDGGHFCAGGDVEEVRRRAAAGKAELTELFRAFRDALSAIEQVPAIVVAAVEGDAVAGGFEIVQASDIAIATSEARIADIHARFGHIPGGGSTQRLPRLLGRPRAMGLILTGDALTGSEAAQWGLVYRAVPPTDFEAALTGLEKRLSSGSASARKTSKRLIRLAGHTSLEAGLDAELEAVLGHLSGQPAEAAAAAFRERRTSSETGGFSL